MKSRFSGNYAYQKDIGRVRVANEDECKIIVNSSGDVLMLVADGMGGYRKGDYAAIETVNYIKDEFINKGRFFTQIDAYFWLRKVVKEINETLYNKSQSDAQYNGMGTTLVLALIFKKKLFILNIGDSRAYLMKDNYLIQLSEDHTYVNYLYKGGKITKEEMLTHPKRNVLTNALGLFPDTNFDYKVYEYSGETVLLCSDGVYNNITIKDIENILLSDQSCEQKLANIVNVANFNGGSDNMSLCLWETIDDRN